MSEKSSGADGNRKNDLLPRSGTKSSVTFSLADEDDFEDALPTLFAMDCEPSCVEIVDEEIAANEPPARKWRGWHRHRTRSRSISTKQSDVGVADNNEASPVARRRANSVKYAVDVSQALPTLARKLSAALSAASSPFPSPSNSIHKSSSTPTTADESLEAANSTGKDALNRLPASPRHKIFKISPASLTASVAPSPTAPTGSVVVLSPRVNFHQTLPPITESATSRKCSATGEINALDVEALRAVANNRAPFREAELYQRLASIQESDRRNSGDDTNKDVPSVKRSRDNDSINNYDTCSSQRNRNYDTLTTRNYDTLINALPGSIPDSNSTTMERPPNINAYRMTIMKALNSRASMPQLMHRKGYASSDGASLRTASSYYPPSEGAYSAGYDTVGGVDADGRGSGLESFAPDIKRGKCALPGRSSDFDKSYDRRNGSGESTAVGHKKASSRGSKRSATIEQRHFFDAVYIPVFTNIVGTLLYLRMGYVAGQAGILGGLAIVLFSTLVIGVTALSLSAICSNGKQLKGGAYYVISRSLGPQVGGVIGIIFSLANVGMAALYIVGIAEFMSDLLVENGYEFFTDGRQNDIRLFSIGVCVLLMLIYFAGPDIENRFTLVFFSTYFLSYINWMLGTLLPVSEANALRGVTGYSWVTAHANMFPEFRNGESLITVFAVFFPGFTGMLAGVMYVDQLRNPGKDVASGLFTSIATTAVMYLVAVIACGATMLRDASGVDLPFIDPHTGQWHPANCSYTQSCHYGLMNYYQVAELTSAWRPLIIIGMFGMTISSTMTNMDQGPQNLQAACKDNIFPRVMSYFAREHGPAKLPRRAYIFLAFMTMGLTLIGDLNALNGIVTNMFMAIYILVNYACFDASFVGSPGWRPEFAFYNMWVSLFGAALSLVVMFVVSIESSITICVMFASFLAYFHYFHPDVDWGDSYQAHLYKDALHNLLKLSSTELHVKNYRPQILLLSGNPAARLPLLDFAHSITKGDSLLFCAHIINYPTNARTFGALLRLEMEFEKWLRRHKFKCFYQNLANENFRGGVAHTLQMAGLGRLRPNVLLIGFKSDWRSLNPAADAPLIDDYVGVIRDAFESNYGVLILRNGAEGFDLSEEMERYEVRDVATLRTVASISALSDGETVSESPRNENTINSPPPRKFSRFSISSRRKGSTVAPPLYSDRLLLDAAIDNDPNADDFYGDGSADITLRRSRSETVGMSDRIRNRLEQDAIGITELSRRVNAFRKAPRAPHHRSSSRRIDVWWLYDDGGLTLLIPHLLRMPKSYLEGAELRIITLSGTGAEVDEASIVALLVKFRIEFSAVKVIEVAKHKLQPEIWQDFANMIRPWRLSKQQQEQGKVSREAPSTEEPPPWQRGLISESELSIQRRKTYRQLLTGQLLRQYSHSASIIVLTLPVPNEFISSCLYMAWLDVMTRDLPPVLFVRGNQTSVLTFYS